MYMSEKMKDPIGILNSARIESAAFNMMQYINDLHRFKRDPLQVWRGIQTLNLFM